MKQALIESDDLVAAFTHHRQKLLEHAASVMFNGDGTTSDGSQREAQLSAITISSLEELKVAEEELTERISALADLRDELEQRVLGARQLFDFAPACLLVTDLYGTIREANQATLRLLRLDAKSLERQPLARFIPRDHRRGFRDGLTRIAATDGVNDWRLSLVRPTDEPLEVSATVQVVRGGATPSGTMLFWALRVAADVPASLDATA